MFLISDKNNKSKIIKSIIERKFTLSSLIKAQIILVIGGDGFMLQTLKKFYKLKKPFYGINSGDYGFLMNKFSKKNILKNVFNADLIKISPLEMTVQNKNKKIKKSIAIKEVSILRQSRQATSISVKTNNKYVIKKLRGDGLLVCTPAGSTAYNLSVHGPILNLNSNKLAISPVSPFRPRRWKGKLLVIKQKL